MMSDPYRSEDQVAKLQAENEKLQREKDELTARFGLLKKWPRVLVYACGYVVAVVLGVMIGTTSSTSNTPTSRVALDEGQMADISDRIAWRASRAVGEHRQEFAREVARDLHSRMTLESNAQAPAPQAQACPAPPVCADGVDEHVLGMDKVVSGTIGPVGIGPRSQEWRFSAQAGDEVVFRMKQRSGGLDPLLILADGQRNVLARHDDINFLNHSATVRYRFVHDGIYILRCMDNANQPNDGSYTLSATRVRVP